MASMPHEEPRTDVPASTPRRGRGHIASYAQGRTCSAPECETTLSRYNKAALCWKHASEVDSDIRS